MTRCVAVLAPHPDDETLGCGGTLARLGSEGARLHWIILTTMPRDSWPAARISARRREIGRVARHFKFHSVRELGFPASGLDQVPRGELVAVLSKALDACRPDTLFVPHVGDAHSDHRVCAEAGVAASKSFRHPTLRRTLAYETPSETDFPSPGVPIFVPNSFSDVTRHINKKIKAFQFYAGECGQHPFPRSTQAITARAILRGAASGVRYAEAFQVLKEIW